MFTVYISCAPTVEAGNTFSDVRLLKLRKDYCKHGTLRLYLKNLT